MTTLIRELPGAQWTRRTRVPGGKWEDEGIQSSKQFPKALVKSQDGDHGRILHTEYRPPANVGDKFYLTLRRLGYARNPLTGDYA